MDFTDAYRLSSLSSTSSHRAFAYSPGSTFFATYHHLSGQSSSVVQVRVSTSLQVVRSWTLDLSATAISWSRTGTQLLVVGKTGFAVLSLDHDAVLPTSQADVQGIAASVCVGMEGIVSASWIGSGRDEAICAFTANDLFANIYDLQQHVIVAFANPKRARAFSSPSMQHVALLTRQNVKDGLVILSAPHHDLTGARWRIEERFAVHTNDVAEAIWSPNERYIAVREGSIEYKAQVYSPLGHLQTNFQIDGDASQTQSTFSSISDPGVVESNKIAGGGLGIRAMRWSPDSRFLALGGYDAVIRILESTEWDVAATLDLRHNTIDDHVAHLSSSMGSLHCWREPFNWQAETGGRGIVTYEKMDLPLTVPSLRIDMSSNSSSSSGSASRSGIAWMEWNHEGTLLGVRNDNHPTAVYIFAFPQSDPGSMDQRLRPYLLSIIMLASAVELAAWKPKSIEESQRATGSTTMAIITSEGQSIHLWHYQKTPQAQQMVEAVPIPIDSFQASDFAYSPEGSKMLITSRNDTYCCAIEASDQSISLQQSHS